MTLPSLDEFIENRKTPANSYVAEPGFRPIYVRMSRRLLLGVVHENVLDIANITAIRPGKGTFTRLVKRLHGRGIILYVECVQEERFAKKLMQLGFIQHSVYPKSFYLLAEIEFRK